MSFDILDTGKIQEVKIYRDRKWFNSILYVLKAICMFLEKNYIIIKNEFNKYLYKKTDIEMKMFLGKSL